MTDKAIIAVVFGFGAGFWFAVSAVRKALVFQRAKHWPSIVGTITESVLFQDPTRKNATHFRVYYEFVIGDKIYGRTPRLSGDWFWGNKQQANFVSRYAVGQQVDVFYDPLDPTKNCLDRDDKTGISALWTLAIGLMALASIIVRLAGKNKI